MVVVEEPAAAQRTPVEEATQEAGPDAVPGEVVDADVARFLRMWPVVRHNIWGAGHTELLLPVDVGAGAGILLGNVAEVLDDNPYLQEAAKFYGVQEHIPALILVRFRESSNIIYPCVVGLDKEQGPFQFKLSTWAGTPYAHLDPCDLEAATWAAAWKVSQPEGWRAWIATWPRGGTP